MLAVRKFVSMWRAMIVWQQIYSQSLVGMPSSISMPGLKLYICKIQFKNKIFEMEYLDASFSSMINVLVKYLDTRCYFFKTVFGYLDER